MHWKHIWETLIYSSFNYTSSEVFDQLVEDACKLVSYAEKNFTGLSQTLSSEVFDKQPF